MYWMHLAEDRDQGNKLPASTADTTSWNWWMVINFQG